MITRKKIFLHVWNPGISDFPPEDCAKRNHLFRVFRNVARASIFMNMMHHPRTLIYTSKNQALKLHFNCFIKIKEKERSLSGLTPTLARMVATRATHRSIKWYNIGEHFLWKTPKRTGFFLSIQCRPWEKIRWKRMQNYCFAVWNNANTRIRRKQLH